MHEIILFYKKNKEFSINPQYERQYLEKPFMGSKQDEKGKYYVDTILRDCIEGAPFIIKDNKIIQYNTRPVLNLSTERVGYPTQKPKDLIKLLTEIATQEGDLICDFFAGSGTIADVAENIKRIPPSLLWVKIAEYHNCLSFNKDVAIKNYLDDFFEEFFRQRQDPQAPSRRKVSSLGSGFVIDPEGIIIPKNHVI